MIRVVAKEARGTNSSCCGSVIYLLLLEREGEIDEGKFVNWATNESSTKYSSNGQICSEEKTMKYLHKTMN